MKSWSLERPLAEMVAPPKRALLRSVAAGPRPVIKENDELMKRGLAWRDFHSEALMANAADLGRR